MSKPSQAPVKHRSALSISALFAAGALVASCTEGGGTGSGGGNVGANGTGGGLNLKNLVVTVDKTAGEIRLTMLIENGLSQGVAGCTSGTVSTSDGQSVPIAVQGGTCGGFVPAGGVGGGTPAMEGFCPQDGFYSVCDYGLLAGESSSVATLAGASYGADLQSWEQPGTEYTVNVRFLLDDASPVDVTATAAVP